MKSFKGQRCWIDKAIIYQEGVCQRCQKYLDWLEETDIDKLKPTRPPLAD